jgi:hypothetical protein
VKRTATYLAKRLAVALVVAGFFLSPAYGQRCGGTERWAVKVGTDPDAASVNLASPVSITVGEINKLPDPRGQIGKDTDRIDAEKRVYSVRGILRLFKYEADDDYHLVITDASLKYSKGGKNTKPTGTSFIAEIPDPKCYMGKKGPLNRRSHWETQIRNARDQFEIRLDREEEDKEMNVPVTIVGVAFFDRDHGQTGRARNGFELHPVISITFEDAAPIVVAGGDGRNLIVNSGFEDGQKGWTATSGVIEIDGYPEPPSGDAKATLGDLGERKSTLLSQQVRIPADVGSVRLTYRLRVKTREPKTTDEPVDTLAVQIRDTNGKWLRTVARYSNLDKSAKYKRYSIDMSSFKGRTIRLHFKSQENSGKATAFLLDDVELRVQ